MFKGIVSAVIAASIIAISSGAIASDVRGPLAVTDVVDPYETDVFTLRLRGGERTAIFLRGDSDTDLDCRLLDSNGNVMDSDSDFTDTCALAVTPRWTGRFTLEIKNLGGVANRYVWRAN